MSKLNIRIHECGSSASSLGPSPMGVLRMQPAKKKSEASDGLDAEWNDLDAVLKGLFLRNVDEPSGKYFYVKSDYRNGDDTLHSVYNKGQDTLFLEIHLVGTEPNMAVVNPGNYTDETFDKAYGVVEPIAQEMFRSLDSNGYHGTISKIDDASEYGDWKKQHVYEDKLGAAPIDWYDFDKVVKRVLLADEDKDNFKGRIYRSVPVLGKGRSSVHICTLDDDTPLITIWPDYSNDSRGHVYVYNNNLDPAIFNKACSRIRELCWGVEKALAGNYDYPLTFHPFASREEMNQYFLDVDDLDENRGGVSAASRGTVPTGMDGRKSESKNNESVNPIDSIYGDGGLNTYEHSADGFFPTDTDTLAKAVYNNDVETIKKLHDSNLKTYEEPDKLTMGWHDDYDDFNDDSTHYWYYDWDWDYDQSFVKDFRRVIGLTDNQDALRLMLQYEPDFIVCSADFGNAIHAGYDKELIKRLFYNIRAAVDDDDDLRINYLGDDDYVTPDNSDPIENIEKFLEE